MNAEKNLSDAILQWMKDHHWKGLNEFQAHVITQFFTTSHNLILSGRTGIGKSEAWYFSVLSDPKFVNELLSGVGVLYIAPLKALINGQTKRLEDLCERLGVRVTKWHGESKQSEKRSLLNKPEGIMLTTPESMEAMFQCHPEYVTVLFGKLKYIVIDEMHTFLGRDRGTHLQSLLFRRQETCQTQVRYFGLSATLGDDIIYAKSFFGEPEKTKVISEKSGREIETEFRYFPEEEKGKYPDAAIQSLKEDITGHASLIFCGSRGRTEEIVKAVKDLSEDSEKGHFLSHHGSISKERREETEDFAQNATSFGIFSTITLEHGVDIPSVDLICQIGPVHSVSSILQRAGRSGRRDGHPIIHFYNSRPWEYLQNRAGMTLAQKGRIEATDTTLRPYHVVLHQVLSLVREKGNCSRDSIMEFIRKTPALSFCSEDEANQIVDYALSQEILQEFNGELIIGLSGERLVGRMDSYTVFLTPVTYRVIANGKSIGELEPSTGFSEGATLLLGAQMWEITGIDRKKFVLYVKESDQGKKPTFLSGSPMTCPEIEQEMLSLLYQGGDSVTEDLHQEFMGIKRIGKRGTPVTTGDACMTSVYPFSGTRVFNTLAILFNAIKDGYRLSIPLSWNEFVSMAAGFIENPPSMEEYLLDGVSGEDFVPKVKLEPYLPPILRAKTEASMYYDLTGAIAFLGDLIGDAGPVMSRTSQNNAIPNNSSAKCSGSGMALEGDIYVQHIFISRSTWPNRKRDKALSFAHEGMNWIEGVASMWNKQVTFVESEPIEISTSAELIPNDYDSPLRDTNDINIYISQSGLSSIEHIGKIASQEHNCQCWILLIHVDSPGRSYAQPAGVLKNGFLGTCFIFNGKGLSASGVDAHEILHLFGAWDLYEGPGEQSRTNAKMLRNMYPNEVMLNPHHSARTRTLSPVTAWRIGLSKEKEPWFDTIVPINQK